MNLYVHCEGKTESLFVSDVLAPYLWEFGLNAHPVLCISSKSGKGVFKGGVSTYGKLRHDLENLCKEHKNEQITTMFDYYGLPKDTPGLEISESDLFSKIEKIETEVENDIGQPNLMFNLIVHEFEGLLFCNPEYFELLDGVGRKELALLAEIRNSFKTPEHINNSFDTAPSKRILKLINDYDKVFDGVMLATITGIPEIKRQCPHFNRWITRLENLAQRQ